MKLVNHIISITVAVSCTAMLLIGCQKQEPADQPKKAAEQQSSEAREIDLNEPAPLPEGIPEY